MNEFQRMFLELLADGQCARVPEENQDRFTLIKTGQIFTRATVQSLIDQRLIELVGGTWLAPQTYAITSSGRNALGLEVFFTGEEAGCALGMHYETVREKFTERTGGMIVVSGSQLAAYQAGEPLPELPHLYTVSEAALALNCSRVTIDRERARRRFFGIEFPGPHGENVMLFTERMIDVHRRYVRPVGRPVEV